jgi:hypothetical protein
VNLNIFVSTILEYLFERKGKLKIVIQLFSNTIHLLFDGHNIDQYNLAITYHHNCKIGKQSDLSSHKVSQTKWGCSCFSSVSYLFFFLSLNMLSGYYAMNVSVSYHLIAKVTIYKIP